MILFYNIKTKDIFSVISGRVHPQDVIDKSWIQPSDIKKENIGKYVVPYISLVEEVTIPIKELRVVDKKTMKVEEVVIGTEKIKRNKELVPDVSFAKEILEIEVGKALSNYKFDDKTKILSKIKV